MSKWKTVKLQDIVVPGSQGLKRGPFGGAIRKDMFVAEGYKIYEQKHAIYGDFQAGTYYINDAKFQELKGFSIQADDLLVSCSGTMGRISIVPKSAHPGIINQALLRIRPDEQKVLPIFLKRLLETPEIQESLFGNMSGSAIKNVKPLQEIRSFNIPLPPIAEQKRIAAILDKAEELRGLRRQALGELDAITQSIFLEMFGDPVTNPKGWTTRKFADIGVLDRGISKNRPRNAPELLGGMYPLIQTGDVANCDRYIRSYTSTYSEIGLRQSRMWKAGTLCITIAANIAKTGILTFDACFPDSVVGFQPNSLSSTEYVQSWLSFLQATLEATAPESAQKNINLAILRNLDIPTPPLSLQQEFARRVEAIEQLKATHRESLAHLDALFASLQHRAFRGEL